MALTDVVFHKYRGIVEKALHDELALKKISTRFVPEMSTVHQTCHR
jgi:hypothetical protein